MIPVIPRPLDIELQAGHCRLGRPRIEAAAELEIESRRLSAGLSDGGDVDTNCSTTIRLALDPSVQHREGYRLSIQPAEIAIAALTQAGIAHGIQSLLQMVRGAAIENQPLPCCIIADQPRFPWRGLMMDVSRHFFDADQVCRMLDLMAMYKLNRFHWHLTDDQGWRLPVAKYPRLTEIGGFREGTLVGHDKDRPRRYDDRRYGGFYTVEDIRRVVAHAASLHITIVPEIDMPGHMQAAIAAYPHLGNTTAPISPRCHWGISQNILNPQESTVQFMEDVLAEVCDLFPGEFVHIGGDEALKHEWAESRSAQDRMLELGLKSEHEMQSWFIARMGAFLATRGRRLIGWDEILEGGVERLPQNAAVMSWRGMAGGIKAAAAKHDVVMTPTSHTYFDFYQAGPQGEPLAIGGMTTLEKVYGFDPIPPELETAHHGRILGGQGQLWAEYIPTPEHQLYMSFPRACALAEVLWSPKDARDWNHFVSRMRNHGELLGRLGVKTGPMPADA